MIDLLGQTPMAQWADIREPVAIYSWLFIGSLAAIIVIALLVLFWALRRRRRKLNTVALEPVIPPAIWAREQFDRIEAESAHLDDKHYTSGVADVLRTYLERAFEVPAPERTTEEFLQLVGDHPIFADAMRTSLDSFLRRCDLVKFARQSLGQSERAPILSEARMVVEKAETKRVPLEAVAPAGGNA